MTINLNSNRNKKVYSINNYETLREMLRVRYDPSLKDFLSRFHILLSLGLASILIPYLKQQDLLCKEKNISIL